MEVVCQGEYIKFLHIRCHVIICVYFRAFPEPNASPTLSPMARIGVVDRVEGDWFQFFRVDLSVGQNALVCADVHDLADQNAVVKAFHFALQCHRKLSLKSATTPHAAFMASGLPSLSYVAIIRTGSGYMFGFAPKFSLQIFLIV